MPEYTFDLAPQVWFSSQSLNLLNWSWMTLLPSSSWVGVDVGTRSNIWRLHRGSKGGGPRVRCSTGRYGYAWSGPCDCSGRGAWERDTARMCEGEVYNVIFVSFTNTPNLCQSMMKYSKGNWGPSRPPRRSVGDDARCNLTQERAFRKTPTAFGHGLIRSWVTG